MGTGPRGRRVRLFVFGLGYSALALARRAPAAIDEIVGTVTSVDKRDALDIPRVKPLLFDSESAGAQTIEDLTEELGRADALLVSVPPDDVGDPVLQRFDETIAAAARLRFIGYL